MEKILYHVTVYTIMNKLSTFFASFILRTFLRNNSNLSTSRSATTL